MSDSSSWSPPVQYNYKRGDPIDFSNMDPYFYQPPRYPPYYQIDAYGNLITPQHSFYHPAVLQPIAAPQPFLPQYPPYFHNFHQMAPHQQYYPPIHTQVYPQQPYNNHQQPLRNNNRRTAPRPKTTQVANRTSVIDEAINRQTESKSVCENHEQEKHVETRGTNTEKEGNLVDTVPMPSKDGFFELTTSEMDYVMQEIGQDPDGLDRMVENLAETITPDQFGGGKLAAAKRQLQRFSSDYAKYCYIEHTQETTKKRGRGAVLSIEVHSMYLRDLEKEEDITTAFPKMFDEFLNALLRTHGLNPETAKFCFELRHPDLLEPNGYFENFQTSKTVNGVSVMNKINKFAQSCKSISLSSPLSLSIHVHNSQASKCIRANTLKK